MKIDLRKGRRQTDTFVYSLLTDHFSEFAPEDIVTTTRVFPIRMRADLQRALDGMLKAIDSPVRAVGLHQQHSYSAIQYPDLLATGQQAVRVGPLQYEEVDVGQDAPVQCLKSAMWLVKDGDLPHAIVLAEAMEYGQKHGAQLEIAVPAGTAGEAVTRRYFETLEAAVRAGATYRGKVLSLEASPNYPGLAADITVHRLRQVAQDEVILPDRTVQLLERNVFDFFAQRDGLAKLGMSTKKGLLFHGPPGTGKTHCIHYLASRLTGHTTLLITAEQVVMLPEYMALARLLQPSIVVIEDADLIARNRVSMDSACEEVMLNKLLNEMDGLKQDAEILFVLTTNRPDALEPALAARPGRIDQTIEFPLPDAACRLALARLYARNLDLSDDLLDLLVRKTDGSSGALIKELMRRIAQNALRRGGDGAIERADVDDALEELLFSASVLNVSVLGGAAIATGQG